MPRKDDVIILGAGMAGLSAALGLGGGYRVLERRDVPGGLCDTVCEDGFRFDRTGHLLHFKTPSTRELVEDLLEGRTLEIARRARIWSQGVYTHYPYQANTFGLPRETVAECLAGFIEARVAAGKAKGRPRTFEEFILRNFGAGIARRFMIPYNSKLWGVHPREISADWCKRFVPVPGVDEVVAGAVGLTQERMGYNASFLYPEGGIGALTEAMARRVANVDYRTQPRAIDARRRRVLVGNDWLPYRALVSTLPLPRLVSLLVDPPAAVARAASLMRCTSLRYLDVALTRPCGTDHHWAYVPEPRLPFYRVGCYSNFSPRMAPRRKANLYVELASRGAVRMASLMPKVAAGLAEMGIIRKASDIAFARPRHIEFAYVVYDRHHGVAVPAVLSWLERKRILSIGRYGRWEYAAMEDAIEQGLEAAGKVERLA